MKEGFRTIGLPAFVLLMALALHYGTADISPEMVEALGLTALIVASLRITVTLVLWATIGLLGNRLLDLLVWQRFIGANGVYTLPRLVVSLSHGLIWVFSAAAAATHLNGEPPLAIITTSSVLVAVIGLALREMIADVASGVVFSFDRPVAIGDYISFRGGHTLQVEDITWRAARLRGLDGSVLVVPNGALARFELVNFGGDTKLTRVNLDVRLPYLLTQEQVEPVLLAAARSVAQAKGLEINAAVAALGFDHDGVNWTLRCWLPNGQLAPLGGQLRAAMLRQLRLAGMEPARERMDIMYSPTPPRADLQERLVAVLAELPIFATLQAADHADIAARGQVETVLAGGDNIVTAGEPGDSMYVILGGEVGVDILLPGGETRRVAHLVAGAVFGEMSLLTGEPRSAHVVPVSNARLFRIDKTVLEPLFARYPELPVRLGEILAQRQLANLKAQQAAKGGSEPPPTRETLVRDLARRIRGFFRLGGLSATATD